MYITMIFLLLFILAVYIGFLAIKILCKCFNLNINSKVRKLIIVLFVLFSALCILFYMKYDSRSYDYGFDCNFCDKTMPYKIKPKADRYYSFYLFDEDDFELVGRGFRYRESSFTIKDFLAYGYNDTSIIAKVTDSLNNVKYLFSYETGYKSKKGNPEISFRDIDNKYFEQVKNKYQWIEIDEKKAGKIRLYKTLFFIGAVVSLVFLFCIILKRKAH